MLMFKTAADQLMAVMVKTQIEWQFYQFQVHLNPPDEETTLFRNLFLGIDGENNDIRFVEDDWESPL